MSALVKKSNGFPALRSMMEDFWNGDKFFNTPFFASEVMPSVNVHDRKNHYELEVAAPGYKKDDFKINTENGLITISAKTSNSKKEEKENYVRQEFSCSSFTRTFSLPEDVEDDKINAHYDNGVLTVELKKTAKAIAAKKEIKVD
ncbi:Hsp20/alpha crystallin family protein [Mucilaginibacter sp.]|jgi:HSP20 family protein|uniref:Hsp20/alpha crystallin family protein n=1 Tax=Mucilaginibacter sp. TaxID=1882438 RepID=UPI002CEBE581|nr:Hsp20/alpha crystallin family protein [Mucilaginibacter sp.]HTI60228.1 Hsp20/alpha crystallin family protein [Mucilaginibacter sp.]